MQEFITVMNSYEQLLVYELCIFYLQTYVLANRSRTVIKIGTGVATPTCVLTITMARRDDWRSIDPQTSGV